MRRFFLGVLFLIVHFYAWPQQFRMDHFGIKDGLSQNTVNCTLRDSEGYYWLGTQDGLNRYDGYSIKVFRNEREDTNSISDNFILQIIEDDWGNLWIGTRNGLNHYSKKTNKFTRIWMNSEEKKEFHSSTHAIFKSKTGNILFSSGMVRCGSISKGDSREAPFKFQEQKNKQIIGEKNTFFAIRDLPGNTVDFFNKDSVLFNQASIDPETKFPAQLPFAVWKGNVVLFNNGLLMIRKDSHHAEPVFPWLDDKKVSILFCDNHDRLWIGTTEGLYVAFSEKEEPRLLVHKDDDKFSLSGNSVESIYEDPSGIMWIGTSEGGVNIYDPAKEVFMHLNHNTTPPLPSDMVWSIGQKENELFVGTNSGTADLIIKKVNPVDPRKDLVSASVLAKKNIGDEVVTCIAQDHLGRTWFGTRSHGVAVYDPTAKKWEHYTKELAVIRQAVVSHLFCDKDGDMWISTQAGLYCHRALTGEFEFHAPAYVRPGGLPAGYIFSATQDKNGYIWIGSTNGLFKYDKAQKKYTFYYSNPGDPKSLSYNMPTSIYEDSKGRLWVCTLGGGINLFDRQNETFTSLTKKQGLANDVTYCMLEDARGYLWISTNGGLSRFDPSNNSFENYGVKEGVISNEFTANAAFKNKHGQLFFGSPEGLVFFQPQDVQAEGSNMPIVLSDLRVNYQSITPGQELNLFHNDKTVTFEFASIDWRRQNRIRYAFKLEGFDTEWNEVAPAIRLASYSNLPFGDYRFKVRVKTGNSPWQEKQLAFAVHVIPPFWFRTWFILLEIAIAFSILFVIVKYYAQRKLKAKLREVELQHKIQLERERISRDLHDNVGSNLTYIISSLDSISDRIEKIPGNPAQVKIESLGEFTRSTMQQLRETIWVINKGSVSVQELRDKINEHVSKMLSVTGKMSFSVTAEGNAALKLSPSVAIHLFRIVQEAVNNSIKHSRATNLEVMVTVSDGRSLTIAITDNGNGFELADEISGHYGLVNMRSRTEEMGGEFKMSSAMGKGTIVKLVVPVK